MTHRPTLRAVSLDAAETLFTVRDPVAETYARLARRHGLDADPKTLGRRFAAVYPKMQPLAFPGVSAAALASSERKWWRELVGAVLGQTQAEGFEGCFQALYAHYADADAWRLFEEVPAVLAELRGRGCRLAVVSNFDSRLPGLLDGLGIGDAVDLVVYSSAAGAAKPDRRIFAAALDALGCVPGEVLHVGDNPLADYEGARAAGLDALLLDRSRSAQRREHCIGSLDELTAGARRPS